MIVDASPIIAILRSEPEASAFEIAIARAPICRISAATYYEAAIVVDSARDPTASRQFDAYCAAAGFVIEPVTEQQARIARAAYRDYGRGSGHRAQLNFGDCLSYAPARATGEPLLFKGEDFRHTDVTPALG